MLNPLRKPVHVVPASLGQKTSSEYVSVWLYLAGLLVTLSGLYAVNFGLDEPNFALMTYGLAIGGYAVSYVLRVSRISIQTLQVPLIVCLGLIFLAGMTSDQGLSWFAPPSVIEDRAKSLQLIFVYMAIIHSFMLSSDSSVLFACVPCMTMLALVSTLTTDEHIQRAFFVFVAASTFIMVHENYLRTRNSTMIGKTRAIERRLFGGQLQLAAFCVIGALVAANFVAVPIRAVGQTLFVPTSFSMTSQANRAANQATKRVEIKERATIDLGSGPVSSSDAPLLRVRSERGLYWRGETLDFYTGRQFQDTLGENRQVLPDNSTRETTAAKNDTNFLSFGEAGQSNDASVFQLPSGPYVLPRNKMRDSHAERQVFIVQGGVTSQIYGAGEVQQVTANVAALQTNAGGGITAPANLAMNSMYQVNSQVPSDDPEVLRRVPRLGVPPQIADKYLQVAADNGTINANLKALAAQITKGLTTEFDRATAIKAYIAQTCKYNLNAPAIPSGVDVVEYFLTKSRQGYCDKFAASMTMLARYAGIPARLASGFLMGDRDSDGSYIVREKHKHLWSELFFPTVGWITFDATEGAEDVTPHNAQTKQVNTGFMQWMFSHGPLPPLLALVVSGLLLYLFKTEILDRLRFGGKRRAYHGDAAGRPETNMQIVAAYSDACLTLARRGFERLPASTPEEYLQQMHDRSRDVLPELDRALLRLTNLHTRFYYGPDTATVEDAHAATEAAEEIRTLLGRARREVLSSMLVPIKAG